jgi:hypothetical protein
MSVPDPRENGLTSGNGGLGRMTRREDRTMLKKSSKVETSIDVKDRDRSSKLFESLMIEERKA